MEKDLAQLGHFRREPGRPDLGDLVGSGARYHDSWGAALVSIFHLFKESFWNWKTQVNHQESEGPS